MSKKFIDSLDYSRITESREVDKVSRIILFNNLKEEWGTIRKSGYEGIDPEMIELVELFNSIPGVATTWCCTGHYVNKGKGLGLVLPAKCQTTHIGFVTDVEEHPIYKGINDVVRAFPVQVGTTGAHLTLVTSSLLDKFRDRSIEGDVMGLNYVSFFLKVRPTYRSPMSEGDYTTIYSKLYKLVVERTLEIMSEGKM